ncbi:insecticidal toxin complex protein [Rhodohalobacter sp. SW132]|uniref:SpvB/TcaC N-terminal domain-containing protein n=1 Tax=Rhodohalobacter sp. SW132 TaxID=2293433 RepID=UPI000E21FDD6|nr:SpvB/TcaC N-terminal domain-containing protein [Rhodohalobacter sp. SW132]REL37873.1 insecticidal toxin complex protein [Rhodohalobacter sp. SW132]
MRDNSSKYPKENREGNTGISELIKENPTQSDAIEIPQISLPKGGGALRGIDEKFEVNAANGTAGFSILLPVTPGRNGFAPSLTLSYNSGAGNSPYGLGWSLSLPAIQRKTDNKLPRYRDGKEEDIFMFSGAEDLVPYLIKNESGEWEAKEFTREAYRVKQYRPRVEGGFARIEKINHHAHGVYWKVTTKKNMATIFGRNPSARIADPEDNSRIFQWMPELSYDDKGNWIRYHYKKDSNLNEDGSLNEDVSIPAHLYEKSRKSGLAPFSNVYLKKVIYGNRNPYYADPSMPYDPPLPEDADYFFEVVMDYGEHDETTPTPSEDIVWQYRQDAFSSYRSGFEIRTNRLCKRILMFHHFEEETQLHGYRENGNPIESPFGVNYLVRSLDLQYEPAIINRQSFSIDGTSPAEVVYLSSVTQNGYIRKPDGSYSKKALPPIEFTYEMLNWNREVRTVSKENIMNAPVGLTNNYQWVDLYGEGISGILTEQGGGWYYKSNLGDVEEDGEVTFTPAQKVIPKPSFTGLGNGVLSLQDLAANGEKQVVVNTPGLKGYYELTHDNGWTSFKEFEQIANVDLQDPNTRLIDLNGDGQAELVVTEENVFVWYAADGKKGHHPAQRTLKTFDEEEGPAIVFADSQQTIFLADMSGDGLTDIARIRNGEVCYWANKGYGTFSAKVSMSNAPVFDYPDQFNPQYLHLADVSGTGATDIIYLGKNKFRAFINLCGNSWSDAHEIEPFLSVDSNTKLSVTDLLGTGTSCIVWSSDLPAHANTPMRYIDLMDSKKPHVMIHYRNNLGKETRMEYKSSTYFYLQDKRSGKPWITKLPFPVQVVNRSIVEEKITDVRFSSQYRYHHGYYDHPEREFRGFGMVEQIDTEYYPEWSSNNAGNQLEKDEKLYQKPVLTKTWFHTGAFLDRERILDHFKSEYWFEEYNRSFPDAPLTVAEPELSDATIEVSAFLHDAGTTVLNTDEWREALRSCKGMTLRQEVFALDGEETDPDSLIKQAKPFSVATHNSQIQMLQQKGNNRHAVFMVTEKETIAIQYERNEADPRIAHTLNVSIDDMGNVLESASVVYPRKIEALNHSINALETRINSLSYEREEERTAVLAAVDNLSIEQAKTLITYTVHKLTDDILEADVYRLRLPCETKIYEITGLSRTGQLFQIEDFNTLIGEDNVIGYNGSPDPLSVQLRPIEHIQSTYYNNDLTAELGLEEHGNHGIPFQTYQLAWTPDLLAEIFEDKLPSATVDLENLLSDNDDNTDGDQSYSQCRFVHRGDDNWWIRSGTTHFYQNTAETFTDMQDRFFTPQTFLDPFGSETRVSYYKDYFLLMDTSTNAIGNEIAVEEFNFRTLSPTRMRDINDNLSEVLVDELGLVKAMSMLGKGEQADNLHGLSDFMTVDEPDQITGYFSLSDTADLRNHARALLQNATARFVYDFNRYANSMDLLEDQERDNPEAGPCEQVKLLPIVVGSILRERHVQDVLNDPVLTESPLQLSFEYSDGLGNVAMKKVQAEPGPALRLNIQPDCSYTIETVDTGADDQLRWIGSGRTVLNNKGNPVKQYEPYFSVSPFYEDAKELVERGVTPIIHYDVAGRNIRTELPDGTFTRVEFDPWQQATFDTSDTVLETDAPSASGNTWYEARLTGAMGAAAQQAAEKSAVHSGTPSRVFLDTLGRPILSLEHNRWNIHRDGATESFEEIYGTFIHLDIEGNARSVVDGRGNTVMSWKYDILGHRVYQESMDTGRRWMLNNVAGNPIQSWDERGHILRYTYDILQRPLATHISDGDGETHLDHTIARIFYGEGETDDKARNLRGQAYRLYDSSGLLQNDTFDFKGGLLTGTRQLASDPEAEVIDWPEHPADSLLDSERFTKNTRYDALGRIVRLENWHSANTKTGIYIPQYNARGVLQSENFGLDGSSTPAIADIQYNEKGQRTRIQYGNDTVTRYEYDPLTNRLLLLRTTSDRGSTLHQELHYTYDASGNITEIRDDAYRVTYFDNVRIEPRSRYTYDSLYRLIEARGRENSSFNEAPSRQEPDAIPNVTFPENDATVSRNYVQSYTYDVAGNILEMRHRAGTGSFSLRWTRNYEYAPDSNRLTRTSTNSDSSGVNYDYDAHGSMLNLINSPDDFRMSRDYRDMIHTVNLGGGGRAYYQYDSNKQRTRKRIERLNGTIEERIYLEGMEIYRRTTNGGSPEEEIETHHLFADDQRVLIVEDVKFSGTSGLPEAVLFRYQYSNHLGSVGLELNQAGQLISYEEYHPYGTTAYRAKGADVQSVAKRYRYTGMERDEETGLSYHTARYYLSWLGRWGSADPIGIEGGENVYTIANNNPIRYTDSSGLQPNDETETESATANSAAEPDEGLGSYEVEREEFDWDGELFFGRRNPYSLVPPLDFPILDPELLTLRPPGLFLPVLTPEGDEIFALIPPFNPPSCGSIPCRISDAIQEGAREYAVESGTTDSQFRQAIEQERQREEAAFRTITGQEPDTPDLGETLGRVGLDIAERAGFVEDLKNYALGEGLPLSIILGVGYLTYGAFRTGIEVDGTHLTDSLNTLSSIVPEVPIGDWALRFPGSDAVTVPGVSELPGEDVIGFGLGVSYTPGGEESGVKLLFDTNTRANIRDISRSRYEFNVGIELNLDRILP